MNVRRSALILAAVALAVPSLAADDPVFGSFTLDAVHSTGGERCAVFSLDDLGNGKFRYSETRVPAEGVVQHHDGIFAFDGGDHSDGAGGTAAFTRIDAQRYVLVTKGPVHATAMRTLTDDGATLTENADGVDDGDAFHASRVFTRGIGTCEP